MNHTVWSMRFEISNCENYLPAAKKRPPTALRPSEEDEFVAMNKTVVPIVVAKTPEKSNKYNAHRT